MTPQEIFDLAISYYTGEDGKQQDYNKAYELCNKAAEAGYPEAMGFLGFMHYKGIGIAKDYQEAFRWTMEAAKHNLPDAQNNVAYMLKSGEGIEQNLQEAIKWYKLAAEQGNSEAQCDLAELYQYGNGVERNYAEAEKWYKLAAEQGDIKAIGKLKDMNDRRLQLLMQHAEQGDKEAQFKLGHKYHRGGNGVKRDHVKATKWYKLAAEQGHINAQVNLAYLYTHGRSVKHDIVEGVRWYKLAAEQGDASAQYYLAQAYHRGIGIKQDYIEAAKWFSLAAEQGIAGAQYYIAMMYEAGIGVEKDIEKAMAWYTISAEKEYPASMRRLGNEYYNNRDYEDAYILYQKAANNLKSKDIDSILMLADMHLSGLGCDKDKAKAIEWLRRAADMGSEQARRELCEIYLYSKDIKAYLRNLHQCKDIVSLLTLAEIYLHGTHVTQDTYKAISIWKDIANQGYKCAHYNLAQAYYFGVGVRKDVIKAQNYLEEVKDFDFTAAAFLNGISQADHSHISSPIFRIELKGCFQAGSILEAEWLYIYAKSNYKGQSYLEALYKVIEIYKTHPSKDSYFWLARLYLDLNVNSNYILSEYYFEKAIAANHAYAKYIRSINKIDTHYSEYNLYSPYYYRDILNSIESRIYDPKPGLQISKFPEDDRIKHLVYIYIAYLAYKGHLSLKPNTKTEDDIMGRFSLELDKLGFDIEEYITTSQDKLEDLFLLLSKRDKEELREELIEYIWEEMERDKRCTTSYPSHTFYEKLTSQLKDSRNIMFEGKEIKNLVKYLSNDGKHYEFIPIFNRSLFELLPMLVMRLCGTVNFHNDWSIRKRAEFDTLFYCSDFSSTELSEKSQLAASNRFTHEVYKTKYGISKFIILVNREYCSSVMTRFQDSRVRLIEDGILESVIELDKSTFADVDTSTALLVLDLCRKHHEVRFEKDEQEIVIPYSDIERKGYILNYDIYTDSIIESANKETFLLRDLIITESGSNNTCDNTRKTESHNIAFKDSLLGVLSKPHYREQTILIKYDNGIKLCIQDTCAPSLNSFTLSIAANSLVSTEYLVYLLLSPEFKCYMDKIVDKNGDFIPSDILFKTVAIHSDKNVQKQIVEDAMVRERQRYGSGIEYNVVVFSDNPRVIDAFDKEENISILGKDLTLEDIFDKYIKDTDQSIIDAIVADTEHPEYENILEEFVEIRKRNIHIYLISKEKTAKGKKKIEYFEGGNRMFDADEEFQKALINKLRDDLDASNSYHAKIRMKHKDVFEAADSLDKKHGLNISKVIMRYIQNGYVIDYAENTPFDQLRTICHKLINILASGYGLLPSTLKEGAVASLLADGSYTDKSNRDKHYVILHPIMNKHLAKSLEYFCYIANNSVHGKQDSSKLGTAAINILMEFILWFYDEDIVRNRLSVLKGNGRMLFISTDNSSILDEFIDKEYEVKCKKNADYFYIDDTHIAGVGIHVQQNKNNQLKSCSKIRITKRIGFEKDIQIIGETSISLFVNTQNYEIIVT